MQLSLNEIVPIPLRDKISSRASGMWNKTLSFNSEDYLFVQAPSGTGKTTLIHILYGLRTDYTGLVKWGAEDLPKSDTEKLAKLRGESISIIFQDLRLFPQLTAWENIDIKRQLTNTTSDTQAKDWMHRLGLGEHIDSPANTLSYGEQQRVAIIRALVQPFEWLLMDEPFSHLDHANTEIAITLILEVVRNKKAGMLLADLDTNRYFPYTETILL